MGDGHTGRGQRPRPTDYDAELRRYNEVLREGANVRPRDHILDIGCGTGRTTRQAARAASAGSAYGIDVSAAVIERARQLARDEGIHNVRFDCADAQVHRLPPERFDMAISRFGTMFFGDPVAAFANIGRALRAGGRLVMTVWQSAERNEWEVVLAGPRAGSAGRVEVASGGPDPFSLADPATTESILVAAGFEAVAFIDVHEPVYYGADVASALDWVRTFASMRQMLAGLDPDAQERTLGRLRGSLAAHMGDDGVWFDARAWIVTARRPA